MTFLEIPYRYIQKPHQVIVQPFRLNYKHYLFAKRAFDLLFCVLVLPLVIIPFLLICVAIVIDSPGSPIHVQRRAGYKGRVFRMFKFRTLWKDYYSEEDRQFMKSFVSGELADQALENGRVAKYKPLHSTDVTRVGKLLRKVSLDELPQIFNVIRGDMTIVGPRPNVLWEVEAYKPWHNDRLSVQPGITGLAQVLGRSDITFDDIVRYDIQYSKNQSFHMDAWIFMRTIKAIFLCDGAG